MASLQAQSTGEDSNGSDHSLASDDGELDVPMDGLNGSMDQRHSFPSAFLGLQGIPGLLPGPSGMHGDSFGKFIIRYLACFKPNFILLFLFYLAFLFFQTHFCLRKLTF